MNATQKRPPRKNLLIKEYIIFSGAFLGIILLVSFTHSIHLYRSVEKYRENEAASKAQLIEYRLSSLLESIADYNRYVGRNTLLLKDVSPFKVHTLFQLNSTVDTSLDSIFSWLPTYWVDGCKYQEVSKLLLGPDKTTLREILKDKEEKFWVLQIGSIQKDPDTQHAFLPLIMSVGEKEICQGIILSKLYLEQIDRDIKKNIGHHNVEYVVLDLKNNPLAHSLERIDTSTFLADLERIHNQKREGISTYSITPTLHYDDTVFRTYLTMQYPFTIITGFNKETLQTQLQENFLPYIMQIIGISVLALVLLFAFRKWTILPIIRGLTKHIEKTLTELNTSNQELKKFTYMCSHDLKEPLRTISVLAHRVADKNKTTLDLSSQDYIRHIILATQRLKSLVDNILLYSQTENVGNAHTDVDMNEIVAEVEATLTPKEPNRKLKITTRNLPVVYANGTQMVQLLQNLFSNAITFNQNTTCKITVSAKRQEGNWLFSVKDNGIGIEEEYHDTIFELFKKLHGKDQYEGTGIGLALCRKIVRSYGGEIWVKSSPGKGTTFFFTIPMPHSTGPVEY